MTAPVEVTTRYVSTVDDLPAAWAFVMARLDSVGPDPSVSIRPIRIVDVAEMHDAFDGHETTSGWTRQFEVVVEGMVAETTHA